MKLAIMQPYFFPYIGYWQLLNAVDRFVIYDDVNYIKGGWINRNRILINGSPCYITVPLHQASQNKWICDISLQPSPVWRGKLIKSIENTYRKAPLFSEVFPTIEKIIQYETDDLADYLANQISVLATYMGMTTEIVTTSRRYDNTSLSGQSRILDICMREGASHYINPKGGQSLYDTETFRSKQIDFDFIVSTPRPYNQKSGDFIPCLSIIDMLMEIGTAGVHDQLDGFELVSGDTDALPA